MYRSTTFAMPDQFLFYDLFILSQIFQDQLFPGFLGLVSSVRLGVQKIPFSVEEVVFRPTVVIELLELRAIHDDGVCDPDILYDFLGILGC